MKKRNRRSDPQRQTYWEGIVRRWREGGQAVRAFCRVEGVRESAFYFWRQELARRNREATGSGTGAQTSPTKRASRPAPRNSLSPSFLPVHLVGPDVIEAARGVEIVLERGGAPGVPACGSRVVVRVPPGFDRQTLADVLSALEVRPC